ncbi:MAG: CoB--CoM heterodisulfide reductase iron-sulfur subunit B family protein, partial [Deltaproteobacteria bacterium]|nr:CoB--CoM heterodisulfide reductase iron-sulfur subunit B family protein [Deltaproteobacteria bacterium]
MDIAYFPGCSLHAIAQEYDRSARLVCERLDIRLVEVEDWNCCGATAAHSLDHELALGLSARNLSIVNRMNHGTVTTPCAGCFSRLKMVVHELANSENVTRRMEKRLDTSLSRLPSVTHLLQLLMEARGPRGMAQPVVKPLKGLRLASYYGCLLTRPRSIVQFDDSEQPTSMDQLLQALGAETVTWSHKAECCGGSFAASEPGIVVDLGGQVLEAACRAGAEAVVVACPMCQMNLDSRQEEIRKERGTVYSLPVIYFTQLMGLAYGYSPREVGLTRLLV